MFCISGGGRFVGIICWLAGTGIWEVVDAAGTLGGAAETLGGAAETLGGAAETLGGAAET